MIPNEHELRSTNRLMQNLIDSYGMTVEQAAALCVNLEQSNRSNAHRLSSSPAALFSLRKPSTKS